jgi:alkylation response protein AidB-like acyl-CoA dehydrogenase
MTSYIDLPLSGLEAPLTEMEELVQDTCHRFAEEVLRPAGLVLDEMTPEETIAPESPLWQILQQAQELGLSVAALSDRGRRTGLGRWWPGRHDPGQRDACLVFGAGR